MPSGDNLNDRIERRRLPVGVEPQDHGAHVRVWALGKPVVHYVGERGETALSAEGGGYFSAFIPGEAAGGRYQFRIEGHERLFPDPASRAQPEGPHGASEIIDPTYFAWTDQAWAGIKLTGQVIMEVHIGTFTPQGTWRAAIDKLPLLKDVGISLIEMMPVTEQPGAFGWGYDGVDLFAPWHIYGTPDDLRAFVDAAHHLEIGVILDVVYNHLGPDGNFLPCFSEHYLTDRYKNDWGKAINYDGPQSHPVREFVVANAVMWISEFHFDGLRLDATQNIDDASPDHVLAELTRAARSAAGKRAIVVIGENEPQDTKLIRSPGEGGFGIDALWNDDLHHSAMVALTGRGEAYYEDHHGRPQEFISAAKYGYLFQGQLYSHQRKRRGSAALDLPPAAFVTFCQNHDQIANSSTGRRFHELTSPSRARAMTAYFLLSPGTPMLFQGQEFFASARFHYFADHKDALAAAVREGRIEFLSQFPSLAGPASQNVPPPEEPTTAARCRLDWSERDRNTSAVALHRDLLTLRRTNEAFARQALRGVDGAVLGDNAFVLRFFAAQPDDDRLVIVNLGRDLKVASFAEPLLAPSHGQTWRTIWSSEAVIYGGGGTPPIETLGGWLLPGECALVLAGGASRPLPPAPPPKG